MERRVIGENIRTSHRVLIIALPQDNDSYIKVAACPSHILGGTLYYNDGTAEEYDEYKELLKAMSEPEVKRRIPNIDFENDKITYTYFGSRGEDWSRVKNKLEGFTVQEFYRKTF